jgi:hypothetical protein
LESNCNKRELEAKLRKELSETDNDLNYDRLVDITSVFKFLDRITMSVEVRDASDNEIIVYFLVTPICFFLTEDSVKEYREINDITDSEKKMADLFESFEVFYLEMKQNLDSFRSRQWMYHFTSNDRFFQWKYL